MPSGVEFALPGAVYRFAVDAPEVTLGGQVFAPAALVSAGPHGEVIVSIPIEHPLARRFISGGIPRRQCEVKVVDEERVWRGEVTTIDSDGIRVRFWAESTLSLTFDRQIGMVASRRCQHELFGAACGLMRETYTRRFAVVSISSYDLALDGVLEDAWASDGELIHLRTGEKATVAAQCVATTTPEHSHAVISLCAQLHDVMTGDMVDVAAGCDRTIETCRAKFRNTANFGGMPHLPLRNPFASES